MDLTWHVRWWVDEQTLGSQRCQTGGNYPTLVLPALRNQRIFCLILWLWLHLLLRSSQRHRATYCSSQRLTSSLCHVSGRNPSPHAEMGVPELPLDNTADVDFDDAALDNNDKHDLALSRHLDSTKWSSWNCLNISDCSDTGTTTWCPRSSRPPAVDKLDLSDQNGLAGTGQSRLWFGHPTSTNPVTSCNVASLLVALAYFSLAVSPGMT